ncbi:MAG: nucleotidyltransferase family protein, partial [Hungatella sp.]
MEKSKKQSAVGIIAEYNPFHNGHAYQIQRAKELTGSEYCIVVMSGDFVQRGAPAIYDKYLRTDMALNSGADLFLEMPAVFASGNAEDFASCGVALLD